MSFVRFNEMDDMFGRMDRMMNSMMNNMFSSDPFGSAFNMISPFSPSMNPMSRLMNSSALYPTMSFGQHMIPESSYYCSSSMMSMSTDMTGRPQIYESSHTTRSGPNGVKETTSSMRDSRTGLQSMAIGHHIHDRAHVMERSRNHYTGEEEENNQFINIEEEEADQFNSEFRGRMNSYGGHHRRRLLPPSGHRHDGRPAMLALPAPHSSHSSPEVSPHNSHKPNRNHKMSHKKHSDKKTKKPYKKS